MRLIKIAKSYLRQAGARLEDAGEAYLEKNYPYTVRLGQECVELCLKAVLKAVGIEYPKVHDVSDVLVEVRERFPQWFKAETSFLSESSKILVKKREPSLYGGEEEFLSPEDVMNENDAEDALKRAEKTFKLCKRLLEELSTYRSSS
ncbi:MAG: HEPN domain-containing protein [Candidatus Bathyarchaeia archaeon]